MTNHRHLFIIYLVWLWLSIAVLCLAVLGWMPMKWLGLTSLIIFLEQSKLFFLSCLFPLFFKQPKYHFISASRMKPADFLSPLLFLALFLPLTVLLVCFSNVPWLALLLQELFLFFYGVMVISLVSADNLLHLNLKRWYYLVFFLLCAAGPVFFYLRLELTGHSTQWLLTINPFRLASRMTEYHLFPANWLVQAMGLGIIILFFLILHTKRRRFR